MPSGFDQHGRPIPPDAGMRDAGRPYVGILFECCGIYARVYRAPTEREYRGRCPRCLRSVRLLVGENGTPRRQFRAR